MEKGRVEVFISYRRTDIDYAVRLYEHLKARHIAVWYDRLISPATDWRDAIVEHLGKAQIMVILLSAEALDSDELKKELAVADQQDVLLLAARLEDVQPRGAFAYELARSNWFDLFDDPDTGLERLSDFLEKLVKNPGEMPKMLEASTQARKDTRQKKSFQIASLVSNTSVFSSLFLLISVVQFVLYEMKMAPIEQLTLSGIAPMTAFLYVVFAVTIGSPLILLAVLREGVSIQDLPIIITAFANTILLILLIRNFFSWIYSKLFQNLHEK